MRSGDVIRIIKKEGWFEVRQTGSHKHFKHPTLPGLVTVPHPRSDIPTGTLRSISKQSGAPLP